MARPLVKRGGPRCFLWGLRNQAHELGDDEAAAGADDVAEEGHEDAHGDQGGGVGTGEHRGGGGAADVGQGGHGAGEQVQFEKLCQKHENHNVDDEDQEARRQPDMGVAQGPQVCPGGNEGDDNIEHNIGNLFRALDFPKGGQGKADAHDADHQHRPGGLVENGQDRVDGRTGLGGQGGDNQSGTQQEQDVLPQQGLPVGPGLRLQGLAHLFDGPGVGLGPAVKLVRKADGPQQEHDIDRSADRIQHQGIGHALLADVQCGLNGQHISAAAHPAAAQGTQRFPGIGAQTALKNGEARHKAQADGNGGRKEAHQHLGAQL